MKYSFALILFVLFTSTGCVSVPKTSFNHKKKSSDCSLKQLVGPNKNFYTDHYQRKLTRNTKRIGRQ